MVGRDNPKVVTKAGIRDLIEGIKEALPGVKTESLQITNGGKLQFGDEPTISSSYRSSNQTFNIISDETRNNNEFFYRVNQRKFVVQRRISFNSIVDFSDGQLRNTNNIQHTAQDVRGISNPSRGYTAYHDGSGGGKEGPAYYDGNSWISSVDGSTIN